MVIAKPCIHLPPALSTSTYLISASTQLSATPSTLLEPKYHTQLANFPKFRPKNSKLNVLTKHTTHSILEVLIPNPYLDFWNSDPKIHFWANLGRKRQRCSSFVKIGTHGISRMLILIPTLVFWISIPNSIFGQIWAEKVKVVPFAWKLADRVSRGCWFLFRH